jgi:hypothetical protein
MPPLVYPRPQQPFYPSLLALDHFICKYDLPAEIFKDGFQVGDVLEARIQKSNVAALEISDKVKKTFEIVYNKRGTEQENHDFHV